MVRKLEVKALMKYCIFILTSLSLSLSLVMFVQSLPLAPPHHKPVFAAANRSSVFFVDFVGLKSSRRTLIGSSSGQRRSWFTQSSKCFSPIKAAIHFQPVPKNKPSDFVPKVANLSDILAERGACGVGFIANLDNKASHQIVKDALVALSCMEHRGGCGADNDSGDGSGVMTSIPWDLFDNWANSQGIASFDKSHTGVGMVFLPKDDDLMKEAKSVISNTACINKSASALSDYMERENTSPLYH